MGRAVAPTMIKQLASIQAQTSAPDGARNASTLVTRRRRVVERLAIERIPAENLIGTADRADRTLLAVEERIPTDRVDMAARTEPTCATTITTIVIATMVTAAMVTAAMAWVALWRTRQVVVCLGGRDRITRRARRCLEQRDIARLTYWIQYVSVLILTPAPSHKFPQVSG